MKKIVLLLVFILKCIALVADDYGRYFTTFYTSEQTGGHFQNWSAIQDDRGMIYIGNGYGVLEFDGSTWRLITNSNNSFAFSFARDSAGRIYVGSAGELGFLAPDSLGKMQYVSLLNYIPQADRAFNYVWRVFVTEEGIYFHTRERIFLFSHTPSKKVTEESWKLKIWRTENAGVNFTYTEYIDKSLYVFHSEKGLMKMVDDSLQIVPGAEILHNSRVRYILHFPGKANQYLIGTVNEGLWVYDGKTYTRMVTEADPLIRGTLSDLKILPDGNIAIGTLGHGLLLLNPSGKIRLHIDSSSGLISDIIKNIFIDRLGNLWLSMDGGIGMLEYNSDITYYPVQGNGANDIARFNGSLYAATINGIYYLDTRDSEFKPVPGIPKTLFNLFAHCRGHLYSCSVYGIFEILHSGSRCLLPDKRSEFGFAFLQPMSFDSTHFLAGGTNGVYLIKKNLKTGLMTVEKKLPEIHEYVFVIRESEAGIFWLGTFDDGTIRLSFKNQDYNNPLIEKFGADQGLPAGTVMVNLVNGKVVFSTNIGFYRYLPELNRFESDPFYKDIKIGINPSEYPTVSDKNGNIWANSGKELAFYRLLPDGSYRMEKGSFSRFSGQMVNNICPEEDGSVWLGMTRNIVLYKPLIKNVASESWKTIIRTVTVSGDRPVYLGGEKSAGVIMARSKISHKNNDISFEYSGLTYIMPEYNEFSIMLEGYDPSWSSKSKNTRHNYTNLPPGDYHFRVKCSSIIGQEGKEASFAFIISTPWYRTWWSYTLYCVMLVSLIWIIVRLNIRRLLKQKEKLELTVKERTAKIEAQKEQIENAHEEITASINYAKYIQSSVMPNKEQLDSCLGEHFILHKPKEIVSGDFYWVSIKESKVIVAVVDCTGHGVPGAFMSMLGITLLDEIVNKESIINPASILDHLRKEVIDSLKQKGEMMEAKDGMDIAILTIDREDRKLQFAGANNPLYIIPGSLLKDHDKSNYGQLAEDILIEIKGDQMTIGFDDTKNNFSFKEIDIQEGDIYYLFTDGFPDQLGGTAHKRLGYKRFKEQLIKSKSDNLFDQKVKLEKQLQEWMGSYSQTDDILIVGFMIN